MLLPEEGRGCQAERNTQCHYEAVSRLIQIGQALAGLSEGTWGCAWGVLCWDHELKTQKASPRESRTEREGEGKPSVGVQPTALVPDGVLAPGPAPRGAQQHCQPSVL